ncbi:unnamed protein product [Cunninghamella blakesleeana]
MTSSNYVFVFIHGACHGKWCFERKLLPLFEKNNHRAIAFDLPGSGDDHDTPYEDINLDNYTKATLSIIDRHTNENDKIILIGHSLGGITATSVAERIPERIHYVVYLAAVYIPCSGKSTFDLNLGINITLTEDGRYATIDFDKVKDAFYQDCDDDDIEFAKTKLRYQAITPNAEKVKVDGTIQQLNKCYIETLQDHTIGVSKQEEMYKGHIHHVVKIDSSHSPFFSKPEELFNILIGLIN